MHRFTTLGSLVLLVAGAMHAAYAAVPQGKPQATPDLRTFTEDWQITQYLDDHFKDMPQVTRTPYHVESYGLKLCRSPLGLPQSPHGEHWIHVFVSPAAKNTLLKGKGTYPTGTYLLKQKFLDKAGKKTEFYTGMRKREKGYNPTVGDWEFFTLNSQGRAITARGKIDSCMGCHKNYKATDFVSRRYLTRKEDPVR